MLTEGKEKVFNFHSYFLLATDIGAAMVSFCTSRLLSRASPLAPPLKHLRESDTAYIEVLNPVCSKWDLEMREY